MTARPMCAYFYGALIIEVRLFLGVYSINVFKGGEISPFQGSDIPIVQIQHIHEKMEDIPISQFN